MFAAALPIFLLMVPESAGILIPSETTLVGAGVAVNHGVLSLWVAVVAATAGNVCGGLAAYWAGRMGVLTGRVAGRSRVVAACERLFERHGSRAVFVGRLMPLARTFISFPAGHVGVPLHRFVAFTAIGSAVWAVPFVALGALIGEGAARISGELALPLAVAGVAGVWLALRTADER